MDPIVIEDSPTKSRDADRIQNNTVSAGIPGAPVEIPVNREPAIHNNKGKNVAIKSNESKSSLPWVELYRPTQLADLISHGDIITTITRFIDENKLPHMLYTAHNTAFTGPQELEKHQRFWRVHGNCTAQHTRQ